MPVIILGGLAVLLILAGAGGLIAQRRSRRGLEDDMGVVRRLAQRRDGRLDRSRAKVAV